MMVHKRRGRLSLETSNTINGERKKSSSIRVLKESWKK